MTTMNKWTPTTDLLTLRRMGKLLEELGEASNVAARVIIQGIDEVDPGSGKVNRERLENELADVQAQIGCTVLAFDLDQDRMARRTTEKMRQMAEWEALFATAGVPVTVPAGTEGTVRERNLAMMVRILCSRRPDGTFTISEKKRDQALELLRSMGLEGSPLRAADGVKGEGNG